MQAIALNVAARLAALRHRIDARAADRAVEIVCVTKGFGPAAIAAAVDAGCSRIGENYAQELLAKVDGLDESTRPFTVHFIGQLQSNKIRQLAPVVDVWESVDRSSLFDAIATRSPGAEVLIQINATGEDGKGGCPPADLETLVERARSLNLNLDGLMTVGPTSGDPDETRRAFELVRNLTTRLGLRTCSMGMTDDLDVALDAGTTRVRIGTALLGPRPPR